MAKLVPVAFRLGPVAPAANWIARVRLLAVTVPAGRLETTKVTTVTPGWTAAGEVVAASVMGVGVVCAHNPPLPAKKTISERSRSAVAEPASPLRKSKTHLLLESNSRFGAYRRASPQCQYF